MSLKLFESNHGQVVRSFSLTLFLLLCQALQHLLLLLCVRVYIFFCLLCVAGRRQGYGLSPPGRDGDGGRLRRRTVVASTSEGNSLGRFAVEVVVLKLLLFGAVVIIIIVVLWVAKGPPKVWRCRYEREKLQCFV